MRETQKGFGCCTPIKWCFVSDALAESTDVAEESISNIRTVRAFSKEEYHVAKYVSKVTKSYDLGVRKAVADGKNNRE